MCPHDTAGDPVRIPVRSKKHPNLFALVDAEDAELVSQFVWYALVVPNATYAQTYDRGNSRLMHRLIMGATKGQLVDHKNHDGLDNRRSTNLRICTDSQNKMNRIGAQATSQTGYIGVTRRKNGRYLAYIKCGGQSLHLGMYDSLEDAARARDTAAKAYYGEFAGLNFPDEREGMSRELQDRLVRTLYEATWDCDASPFETASPVEIAFTESQVKALSAEIGRTNIIVDRHNLMSVVGDIANAHSRGDAADILKAWQLFDGVMGELLSGRNNPA